MLYWNAMKLKNRLDILKIRQRPEKRRVWEFSKNRTFLRVFTKKNQMKNNKCPLWREYSRYPLLLMNALNIQRSKKAHLSFDCSTISIKKVVCKRWKLNTMKKIKKTIPHYGMESRRITFNIENVKIYLLNKDTINNVSVIFIGWNCDNFRP